MSSIDQARLMSAVFGAEVKKDRPKQWQFIQQLEALLHNPTTPEFRKSFINTTLNHCKLKYFLQDKNKDSTAHYLEAYRSIAENGKKPYYLYLYKSYKAGDLYNQGCFKESADTLKEAISILDSARSLVVQDVDDMLYAQAEAEEKQLLLENAQEKQKDTERKLMLAGIGLGVLLLGGLFIIRFIHHRQQARFLKFKFNLARNIHDEANPALLYAKALIRSQKTANEKEKAQLAKHIDHTMSLIRSLSHDLRSDKQYTIGDLISNTEGLLKTLSSDNSFNYIINSPKDDRHFLSHFQYTEMKAILNECIANTIKHASFNCITISFTQQQNQLNITYKDDGMGWDTSIKGEGIGMTNIRERCENLNGIYKLQSAYPDGYTIQVLMPLR